MQDISKTSLQLIRHHFKLVVVCLAILLFFFLSLDSVLGNSPTFDEPNHIARGMALLATGRPDFSVDHPPLLNILSALPAFLTLDIHIPTEHPSWLVDLWFFSNQLLWEYNPNSVPVLVFLARLPIIFLTIGLALWGYRFADRLWGKRAALWAFLLILLEPNIIAHGQVATTDLGATLFICWTTFLWWDLWQSPTKQGRKWLLAGLVMGLALGSKLSALVFAGIWLILALIPFPFYLPRTTGRRLGQLIGAGILALGVVWALYYFEWGSYHLQNSWLQLLNAVQGPLPTFGMGVEHLFLRTQESDAPAFLAGEISYEGFPLYFLVAFLVKTPILHLLLILLGLWYALRQQATRPHLFFLLVPVMVYGGLSSTSTLNIGYRHLLPIIPLLLVMGSGLSTTNQWLATHYNKATGLLVVGLVVPLLLIHPHYLSYFNLLAGGAENGAQILVDSNIDWGQDLPRLKQWMVANEVEEIYLSWFGMAEPSYYGIQNIPLPGFMLPAYREPKREVDLQNPPAGIYAISVTNLQGVYLSDKDTYAWFRARSPDDRVGYSIYIYRVP